MMNFQQFEAIFYDSLNRNGLPQFSNTSLAQQFFRLTSLLSEANAKMNLTAIREPADMISLHYTDSLFAAAYLPLNATVLDCGCGAGFPSLPLAIARPDLKITALDSTAKKLAYVQETAATLGLNNLTVLCGRAEELAADRRYRERFDVCCARAVASLPVLAELCVPFVRCGGRFVALKGAKADEELKLAKHSLSVLGCPSAELISYRLERLRFDQAGSGNGDSTPSDKVFLTDFTLNFTPKCSADDKIVHSDETSPANSFEFHFASTSFPAIDEDRGIIFAEKLCSTPPAYPRKYAQILKKPL